MSLKQIQLIRKKILTPPPPVYIYGATDYKATAENLAKAVDEDTYSTKLCLKMH
jgi:hypothetical protein